MVSGGDATKTPREGNNDHHAVEMEDDEEEEEEMGPHEIFGIHRKEWIVSYGKNDDDAFYKPSTFSLGLVVWIGSLSLLFLICIFR